jgi:glycosyltransferase involved in cell wall biosynthesis
MVDMSIVIPLYNEAQSLRELTDAVEAVCSREQYHFELIFVDDGSTDDSHQILLQLSEQKPYITYIRLRKNFGKAAALSAGFSTSKGRYLVTLDADLQDEPAEIPRLLEILQQGVDMVVGRKKKRKDPLLKRINSKIFNAAVSRFSGVRVRDLNSGLKVMKREVAEQLNLYGDLHRFIPVLAHWKGFKIAEVPVLHHRRKYGTSKYGPGRLLRGFFDFLTVSFLMRYDVRPLHFFGKPGLLMMLAGLIINIILSIEWIHKHLLLGIETVLSNRPLLLLGILLMIIGVQCIFTGLLGEMILYLHRNKSGEDPVAELHAVSERGEGQNE